MHKKLPKDFDWKFYIEHHKDLSKHGINNYNKAVMHYINYGIKERRIYKSSIIQIKEKTNNHNHELYLCSNGVGDILLYLLLYVKDTNMYYRLDENVLMTHRNNYTEYKEFVNKMLNIFNVKYEWIKKGSYTVPNEIFAKLDDLSRANCFANRFDLIQKLILTDDNINININILCQQYVTIHTKCRIDFKKDYSILNNMKSFFENYKCKYPIMLLGERTVSDVVENKIHNVQNIYNLLTLLNKNNTVYDYTVSGDIQNSPDFELFRKDLTYINKAVCNINMGIGGNFVMSCIFSNKVIAYIENSNYHFINMCDNLIKCINWSDMELEINKLK